MKNRKGFTLIEIIGVVIILGIIALIAIPIITNNIESFRTTYYKNLSNNILNSGKDFYTDNRVYRPVGLLESSTVELRTLSTQKYIKGVVDYNGKSCNQDSYVRIVKVGRDKYEYSICLRCEEDEYANVSSIFCDSAWDRSDNIGTELGAIPNIYVYKGTSRDVVREKVKIPTMLVKYNNSGTEIYRAQAEMDDGVDVILPNNIDVINPDKIGTYTTIYEYKGRTENGSVVVYENGMPYINLRKENVVRLNTVTTAETIQTSAYTSGEWAQKILIEFGSGSSFVEAAGNKVTRYQWKRGNRWIDLCTPDATGVCTVSITEEMNEDVRFRSVDEAGNIGIESGIYRFRIDNTKPTCEVTTTGTIGDNAWYVSNVNIGFVSEATKDLSKGVDVAVSGIVVKSITTSIIGSAVLGTQTSDTTNIRWYGFVEDQAKNSIVCAVDFKKDATSPSCANSGGSATWRNTDLTITGTCSDATSGCVQPTVTETYTTNTDTTTASPGIIKDKAGNTTTCAANQTVKIDKIAPTCTNSGGSSTWRNTNLTLTGTCSDTGGSGCAGNVTKVYSTNINSTTESPGTIYDIAGNSTVCASNQTVKIDKIAPTCVSSGGNSTWRNTNLTLTGTCSDTGGSGCVSNTISKLVDWEINSTTVSAGTVYDVAGNSATCTANQTVRIDKTGPTCTITKNTSGGNAVTEPTTITVGVQCTDSGSGLSTIYYTYGSTEYSDIYQPPAGSSSYTSENVWSTPINVTAKFKAKDQLGNVGDWSVTTKIQINAQPTCTLKFVETGQVFNAGCTGTVNITESSKGCSDIDASGYSVGDTYKICSKQVFCRQTNGNYCYGTNSSCSCAPTQDRKRTITCQVVCE